MAALEIPTPSPQNVPPSIGVYKENNVDDDHQYTHECDGQLSERRSSDGSDYLKWDDIV